MLSNAEEIVSVSEILLKEIEQSKDKVGSSFLKMTDYLKIYSIYCSNYPTALSLIVSKKETEPLKSVLATFQSLEQSGGLPIETFLMKPIQRICKYPLLLKQINNTMPQSHPDKQNMNQAISKIEQVVETVNDRRRQVENSEKIMSIENKIISNEKLNLLTPTRK